MLRRWVMWVAALSAPCCGGGQSGTEGEPPAPESPFQIVTSAGERLSERDGRASVSFREDGPAAVELAVSGVDTAGATWSLLLVTEDNGLLGSYEANVSRAPTAPGNATVARRSATAEDADVSFAGEGTARVNVTYEVALEMRGDVTTPDLAFSFEGPMLFSCSVPHELLPGAPPPPEPSGDVAGPVLITDTNLETDFCRDFMRSRRSGG